MSKPRQLKNLSIQKILLTCTFQNSQDKRQEAQESQQYFQLENGVISLKCHSWTNQENSHKNSFLICRLGSSPGCFNMPISFGSWNKVSTGRMTFGNMFSQLQLLTTVLRWDCMSTKLSQKNLLNSRDYFGWAGTFNMGFQDTINLIYIQKVK